MSLNEPSITELEQENNRLRAELSRERAFFAQVNASNEDEITELRAALDAANDRIRELEDRLKY